MDTLYYEVEIFGQCFTVRSEKGSEHMQAIASAVDKRLRDMAAATQSAMALRIAIMALMQAEDELREAWDKQKGYK